MGRPRAPRPPAALPGTADGMSVEPKLRGRPLPPLTVAEPAGGWTLAAARDACDAYAARVDHETASVEGVATAAWLAISRAADQGRGLTAADRRSLVRQGIESRVSDQGFKHSS